MSIVRLMTLVLCVLTINGFACAQGLGNGQKGNNQESPPQPKQTESTPSKPVINRAPSQPETSQQDATKAELYEPNCNQPKNQPDADLCVQRRVAEAAENALHWSQIQSYVGIVGLGVVLATLFFTAYTGNAAKIAAQAAVDAVGAERAWMSVSSYTPGFSDDLRVDGVHHKLGYIAIINWINAGRSPATNLELFLTTKEVEVGAVAPSFDVPNSSEEKSQGVLGPGVTANCPPVAIVGEQLERVLSNKSQLYIYSRARYEITSAPGVECVTEFCVRFNVNGYQIDQDGSKTPRMQLSTLGPNRAT